MPPVFHVKRRLSDVSAAYPNEFEPIGSWFFEEKASEFLSDQFAQHSKANELGLRDATPVGDDELPQEVQVIYDADQSFTIPVYALSSPGKWQTSKNSDPSLTYEQERTLVLTSAMRILLEYIRVNKRLRDTSKMTTNKTLLAAERFDNFGSGSSLPITLLRNYSDGIADSNQGRRPNRGACAIQTVRAIASSEEFKDLVKYNVVQDAQDILKQPNGQVRLIEQLIGLAPGTLRVHDATYNAGTLAAPSYKKFIGSDFVMGYVEPLGIRSWTLAVGWKWTGVGSDETAMVSVPQFNRGAMPVDELRIIAPTEPMIVKPELGALIKGCVDVNNAAYGGKLD